MDKINPPVQQNYMIRPNQDFENNTTLRDVVSELGIFGTILWYILLFFIKNKYIKSVLQNKKKV